MGTQYKERGGGPATGLANNFIDFLQGGMTGTFGGGSGMMQTMGANPMGATTGMASVLNDILSGGAGRVGGSMMDMISKDTQRQTDALRARFGASGGMSMGTPAAYAEALLRSEQAPKLIQSIGGLQLQALMPMMQIMAQLAGKGISQREMTASPSPWASAAGIAAPMIGSILGGPAGGMIGGKIGSMFGGGLSGAQQMMIDPTFNPATLGTIGGLPPIGGSFMPFAGF